MPTFEFKTIPTDKDHDIEVEVNARDGSIEAVREYSRFFDRWNDCTERFVELYKNSEYYQEQLDQKYLNWLEDQEAERQERQWNFDNDR